MLGADIISGVRITHARCDITLSRVSVPLIEVFRMPPPRLDGGAVCPSFREGIPQADEDSLFVVQSHGIPHCIPALPVTPTENSQYSQNPYFQRA